MGVIDKGKKNERTEERKEQRERETLQKKWEAEETDLIARSLAAQHEAVMCVCDSTCVCGICYVCVCDLTCVCGACNVCVSLVMCVWYG